MNHQKMNPNEVTKGTFKKSASNLKTLQTNLECQETRVENKTDHQQIKNGQNRRFRGNILKETSEKRENKVNNELSSEVTKKKMKIFHTDGEQNKALFKNQWRITEQI